MVHLKNNRLHNIIVAFLGVLLVLILTTIVASMNRGVDFKDESYYLLSYTYANIYREGVSAFHIIISKLSNWMSPGIVTYRLESLLLTLLSSYVLLWGFYKWLKANVSFESFYVTYAFLFLYIFIANFLQYFSGLQTINYNILENTIIQFCTGMLLYLFSFDVTSIVSKKSKLLVIALIGSLCWFSFVIKAPTGILLFMASAIMFVLYYMGQSLKSRLGMIGILCTGVVAGMLVYFALFQSYSQWRHDFVTGFQAATHTTTHAPNSLVQAYFKDILSMFRFCWRYFNWLLLLPFLLLIDGWTKKRKALVYLRNFLVAMCVALFFGRMYLLKFYRSNFYQEWNFNHGYLYPLVIATQLSLLSIVAVVKKIPIIQFFQKKYRLILTALFLLATPFIGAFGTFNQLFHNLLGSAAGWFCLILILNVYIGKHVSYVVSAIIIVVVCAFTTSQIVDGNTYAPYFATYRKTKTTIFDQTGQAKQIPQLKGIYLDTATVRFLNETKAILREHNFRDKDPIWAFEFGVGYFMGGIEMDMFGFNKSCNSLNYYNIENRPPVFITSDAGRKPDERNMTCLRNRGINFPEDYVEVGQVYYPHMNTMAKVFFPKSLTR